MVAPSTAQRGKVMRTTLTAVAEAATIAAAAIPAPAAADARRPGPIPAAGAGTTAIAIGCADDHGFLPRIAEPRPAAPSGPPAFFASSSTVSWPRTDQNSDKLPRLCTSS